MKLQLDIQVATDSTNLPGTEAFERWVTAALSERDEPAELTIRLVDLNESRSLNHTYRQRNNPTNVLSFPADLPTDLNLPLLGDLAICAPLVAKEAQDQGKDLLAHWAHLTIHGTLHLLGYDHILDDDAEKMENRETQLVTSLGFPPPYDPVN